MSVSLNFLVCEIGQLHILYLTYIVVEKILYIKTIWNLLIIMQIANMLLFLKLQEETISEK